MSFLCDIEIYKHVYNCTPKPTWGIQRQMTRGRQVKPNHIIKYESCFSDRSSLGLLKPLKMYHFYPVHNKACWSKNIVELFSRGILQQQYPVDNTYKNKTQDWTPIGQYLKITNQKEIQLILLWHTPSMQRYWKQLFRFANFGRFRDVSGYP